jgi:type 1 glutamine amidotransferase
MDGIDPDIVVLGGNDYDFHRLADLGPILEDFLWAHADIRVETTTDRDVLRPDAIREYDVLIDYTTSGALSDRQWTGLSEFVRSGNGYVGLHGASAVSWDADSPAGELETLVGGAFEGHDEYTRLTVEITDESHPVTDDVGDFRIADEPYRCRHGNDVRVLARAHHDGPGTIPVAWTTRYGNGRVFYYANGHDERAFAHPAFQRLVLNGVRWVYRGE